MIQAISSSPSSRERHVIIVGGGPGGLASAMLLATTGARVTLLERQARVGGRSQRLTSATPVGNFHFDTGPTFFLYPESLQNIYAACGLNLSQEVSMQRLNPLYDLHFGTPDATPPASLRIHADPHRLAAEVARFSPADAHQVGAYLNAGARKFAAFKGVLQRPFNGLRDLLKADLLKALPLLTPWLSVDGDLQRYFTDPRVRLAFSFQSKYLGMSPFQCPSLFTILAYMEHGYGIWHPTGGCNAVIDNMALQARRLGVEIRLNTDVTALQFDESRRRGRITGLTTQEPDGEHHYQADAVVLNADFAHVMHRLVPERLRPSWPNRKLARAKYSCSTFMLYLGIRGRYDNLAHHSIYLSADYAGNLVDIESGRLPHDPSIYLQNASVTDPSLAPPGHSTLYVLAPVAALDQRSDQTDWPRLAPAFRRTLYAQLAKLGLEDLEHRVVCETVRTPQHWQADLHVHRGATFNLAHSMDQMLMFRPKNRFSDISGLYLVGGGTHPGSGLPVIFESARMSSQLLADDLGLAFTSPASQPHPTYQKAA